MTSVNRQFHKPDKAESLLELKYYTEGPVAGLGGEFYFTNLMGKGIFRYHEGVLTKWAEGIQPNGQAIMQGGRHLVCDSQRGVVLYEQDGQETKVLSPAYIEDVPVRCPNDIIIDQENGFYFTDSVRDTGAVFFINWEGKAKVIARNIDYANGIVYHKRKQLLYVAESYKNRILKIDLSKAESSREYISAFITLPFNPSNEVTGNLPDGLALDEEEKLWVAHYGMQALQVISPQGTLQASLDTGIPLTSNLCFMGDEVWVTGGSGEPGPGRVSRLKVGVKGFSH